MKILITGVAGLIGSRFADWLCEKGSVTVIGIDDLSGGYFENINPKVIFYKLDLTSTDKLSEIFETYKPDYVFHFAAYAAEGLSPFIRKYNYDNNLISTVKIINECIKWNVKRLIFTSTLAVYGYGNNQTFDESLIPNPIDPYGVAKFACEMDIKIAGDQHGLDWCILRPHNVYGAKQNIWDKYRNVLGIWMCQYINGENLSIYGDGLQTRAFSYIDDSLPAIWEAAINSNASKQIINLGGIKEYSINEACDTLIDVMGGGKKIFLEKRHEVKNAITTYKKSIEILNFKHKTDLKEGLKNMWEWAKKQPNRKRIKWENYEINKGIYSFWK